MNIITKAQIQDHFIFDENVKIVGKSFPRIQLLSQIIKFFSEIKMFLNLYSFIINFF